MACDRRNEVRGLDRHPLRHQAPGRMAGKVDARRVDAGLCSEDLRRNRAQKGDVIDVELGFSRFATATAAVPAPGFTLWRH